MGILKKMLRKLSHKRKRYDLVVMPDKTEQPLSKILIMAGQYLELNRRYEDLKDDCEKTKKELIILKEKCLNNENKIKNIELNVSETILLDIIKSINPTSKNLISEVLKSKSIKINSASSCLRIIKQLKDKGCITKEKGKLKFLKDN